MFFFFVRRCFLERRVFLPCFLPGVSLCSICVCARFQHLIESVDPKGSRFSSVFGWMQRLHTHMQVCLTHIITHTQTHTHTHIHTTHTASSTSAVFEALFLEDFLGYSFPKGDYKTLGGLLLEISGKIPSINECLVLEGRKFYISQSESNKIIQVFSPKQGAKNES